MIKNKGLKIVAVLIPLVLVASSVALYGFADVEEGVNEEGGLSESDERQTAVQFTHHENKGEKDES